MAGVEPDNAILRLRDSPPIMSYFHLTSASDMETTRLSTKGQIVLPRAIRDAKSWHAGQQLAIEVTADGVLLKALKPFPATRLDDVVGCAGYKGRPLSIDEMNAAVAAEARKRK